MNPTQLSEPVRLNREGGDALEFARLSPTQVLKLRDRFRLVRKAQLLESITLSGITGAESVKILNQFDARRIPQSAVIEWVNTMEGQYEAILLSLQQKPGISEDQAAEQFAAMNMGEDDMLTVAAGVLNLELTVNPPAGAGSTSTSTETSDVNAPSSATTAAPPPTP